MPHERVPVLDLDLGLSQRGGLFLGTGARARGQGASAPGDGAGTAGATSAAVAGVEARPDGLR